MKKNTISLFLVSFLSLGVIFNASNENSTLEKKSKTLAYQSKKNHEIKVYRFYESSKEKPNNETMGYHQFKQVVDDTNNFYTKSTFGELNFKLTSVSEWIPSSSPCGRYWEWISEKKQELKWQQENGKHALFFMNKSCWKQINGQTVPDIEGIGDIKSISGGGTIGLFKENEISSFHAIHEIGHNLGLLHSGKLKCSKEYWHSLEINNGTPQSENTCQKDLYGDKSGIMGSSFDTTSLLNPVQIKELGLNNGIFKKVNQDGQYVITSRKKGMEGYYRSGDYDTNLKNEQYEKRIIEIEDPHTGTKYYLDFVSSKGPEKVFTSEKTGGVFLRQRNNNIKDIQGSKTGYAINSILYDPSPYESQNNALLENETYHVAKGRIMIKILEIREEKALIEIKVGPRGGNYITEKLPEVNIPISTPTSTPTTTKTTINTIKPTETIPKTTATKTNKTPLIINTTKPDEPIKSITQSPVFPEKKEIKKPETKKTKNILTIKEKPKDKTKVESEKTQENKQTRQTNKQQLLITEKEKVKIQEEQEKKEKKENAQKSSVKEHKKQETKSYVIVEDLPKENIQKVTLASITTGCIVISNIILIFMLRLKNVF